MSNVSGIGDAYYWSVFKIAEAFGLHRDTVKKRLLAANTPVAATIRGNPVYALQHVGPALFSVKHEAADSVHDPSRITHINLHINSPGGDVFEGIAIFNALKTHGASITVYVDGVAASMASVIAMVGNPVIMPENTFMMIHKPFGFTGGDAEDMRTYADLLDRVEAVLLPAYAQKTGKTTDEIAAMLADETWMSGAECLAQGFADQVTPAVKAMACIQSKRTEEFKKMPESIRNMITPPRNSAPRVQDDGPAASRTPVQAAAPVVDENSIRAQVLAEQKARVNGINDLFAMFGGRYQW